MPIWATLVAILIPTTFIAVGIAGIRQGLATRNWTPVRGTLTRRELVRAEGRSGAWEVESQYQYVAQGESYTQIERQPATKRVSGRSVTSVRSPKGPEPVDVYYDPANPAAATITPGVDRGSIVFAAIGALMIGVYTYMLFLR